MDPAWTDRLADALGVPPLAPEDVSRLLSAARDVAHGVERKLTPLSTYLLGLAVERRAAAGTPRDEALRDALAGLRSVLPEPPGEPPAS
jgi:hypothetical protein